VTEIALTELQRRILNRTQKNFPVRSAPFALIAEELNVPEETIIAELQSLQQMGVVSRFGAVLNHRSVGASTLAAMIVPDEKMERVVTFINEQEGVNHNYLREHEFNLWFVVTAASEEELQKTIRKIENFSQLEVMQLPMLRSFYLDLAFEL